MVQLAHGVWTPDYPIDRGKKKKIASIKTSFNLKKIISSTGCGVGGLHMVRVIEVEKLTPRWVVFWGTHLVGLCFGDPPR